MSSKCQWVMSIVFSFEVTVMFIIWYYFQSPEPIEDVWIIFIGTFLLAIPLIKVIFFLSEEVEYEEN